MWHLPSCISSRHVDPSKLLLQLNYRQLLSWADQFSLTLADLGNTSTATSALQLTGVVVRFTAQSYNQAALRLTRQILLCPNITLPWVCRRWVTMRMRSPFDSSNRIKNESLQWSWRRSGFDKAVSFLFRLRDLRDSSIVLVDVRPRSTADMTGQKMFFYMVLQ